MDALVLKKEEETKLKATEIRLIAELMKNSRRSDREIAKALGISQPTVSRTIARLEKEGVIKEYTMIPDFSKLGYDLLTITLSLKPELEKAEAMETREAAIKMEKEKPVANIMVMNGTGLQKGRVMVSLYRTYSEYSVTMAKVRSLPHIDIDDMETFIIDLNDKSSFRFPTLKLVARHFESTAE